MFGKFALQFWLNISRLPPSQSPTVQSHHKTTCKIKKNPATASTSDNLTIKNPMHGTRTHPFSHLANATSPRHPNPSRHSNTPLPHHVDSGCGHFIDGATVPRYPSATLSRAAPQGGWGTGALGSVTCKCQAASAVQCGADSGRPAGRSSYPRSQQQS